jgi:hypothetical protein
MRIGVKYCGGCNPRYDRVAAVARLKADFPACQFVSVSDTYVDFAVIVSGCERACAAGDIRAKFGSFVLTSDADYNALRRAVAEALQKTK